MPKTLRQLALQHKLEAAREEEESIRANVNFTDHEMASLDLFIQNFFTPEYILANPYSVVYEGYEWRRTPNKAYPAYYKIIAFKEESETTYFKAQMYLVEERITFAPNSFLGRVMGKEPERLPNKRKVAHVMYVRITKAPEFEIEDDDYEEIYYQHLSTLAELLKYATRIVIRE